ncbi:Chemotactic transducer-related protein [hydrothermal vent metagenome]|uniref:Chemotactic transducer-related protein n=1 Tax=hydrothermal vent metagenome TaxID=652676 RepID=A0A3B0XRG7_9ZZZZ
MTQPRKFSLHVILATLFAVLILCVGSIIGVLNYTQTTKLLLSASDEIYDRASKEIVLNYRKTYNPVFNSLELLSHSSVSNSSTLSQRLKFMNVFVSAMNTEESIAAMQLGYDNGDFFIVRKLNTKELRKKFSSPEGAIFVIDNVSFNKNNQSSLLRIFMDESLQVIKRNDPIKTDYDPRERPWFKEAKIKPKAIAPYYFYFMQKVGTTVTMKMKNSNTVIATDITLENISIGLENSKMTEMSELYLITSQGAMIASSNANEHLIVNAQDGVELKNITNLNKSIFSDLNINDLYKEQSLSFRANNTPWQGAVKNIGKLGDDDLYLIMFTPIKELLKDAIDIAINTLYLLLMIIVLTIPVVWYLAKRISFSMHELALDAKKIMYFDFSESKSPLSLIEEVDDLAKAQTLMKLSLSQFMGLINSLASEKNFDSLLEKITLETLSASHADAVATYLVNENSDELKYDSLKFKSKSITDCNCLPGFSLINNKEISELIDSSECKYLYQNSKTDKHWSELASKLNSELRLVLLPLRNRQSEFMGMIVLAYAKDEVASEKNNQQSLSFVQAFSEFAAVSLESKKLLKMQEDLLDAFIKLIAGAIDAKSPYTGGHCQRVPEITKMLAQAACESKEPLFIDYELTQDQWQEIHIASWLHDCGKVTTPEYVVDKSTKLETIYDRIHEIRTRFEVLKRDTEIDYWKARSAGEDEKIISEKLKLNIKMLDEDFEFVAICNQGGEFMEDEKIARLNEIAEKTWMRTLDNKLGVSWEEKQRMDKIPQQELPVKERLLADKIEHVIEREVADCMPVDNQWGFKLNVPENKFNRGELYNLSIKRGTLCEEERFIINNHMVQTIIMLEELPYPSHLKNVPVIAGCHHESMDGKGYPKKLNKDDMPLTARMMAIADIFEALTASDRPYKKAKTLSESIRIMNSMCKNKHIDSDLFDLFLTSGVYLKYADLYLDNEQIDDVDINQYLSVS